MMATMTYKFATATAECNDAIKDTWEVQAKGSDGKWWTISDSSEMTSDDARSLASDLRAV